MRSGIYENVSMILVISLTQTVSTKLQITHSDYNYLSPSVSLTNWEYKFQVPNWNQ